ncbi:MAG: Bug family tripartite tricarboxylate transporter substrate binding protein [Burkholderiaceae bacterium]
MALPRLRELRVSTLGLLVGAALFAGASVAAAQSAWPERSLRLIVPFPPGGTVDAVSRIIAPKLSERLGKPVVIENRSGAGGMVGTAEVARAAPDGYTLGLVFDSHAVNHHLYRSISFDTFKAFRPVSLLTTTPMTLVASTKSGISSVPELVARLKAAPGTVTSGHVGAGSSNQLAALAFAKAAGVTFQEVPYRGAGPLAADLLAGHVDTAFSALPVVAAHVRAGKLTGLAVASERRMSQLPDTPTVSESYPGVVIMSWIGMVAPAGVPEPIARRLQDEVGTVLGDPAVRAALTERGFSVVASSPGDFGKWIQAESERLGALIHQYKITVEN